MNVTVIDSVMGSGKTSRMLEFIGNSKGKKWLYISPFKSEVGCGNTKELGRVQLTLPDMFPISSMPRNTGEGKLDSLHKMILDGVNIATTHALFCRFSEQTTDLLLQEGYSIVIDESVDCVQFKDDLTDKEVKALLDSKWITVDPDTKIVSWNEEGFPLFDGRYKDIRELASTKGLRLFEGNNLVLEYSPKLLRECKECYIMSYLFSGSLMSCWLKINNVEFHYADNALFNLEKGEVIKEAIRGKLVVLSSRKLDNKYKSEEDIKYRYSTKWYDVRSTLAERLEVRSALESCVSNHKTPEGKVFWTTFKDHRTRLEGRGYKKGWVDPSTGVELPSFLAFNTQSINEYRNHDLVMHTVNLYRNPTEVRYFKWRGVDFDGDLWALGVLLQFVWRSSLRQGQPTKVLVISKRMRKLLTDWLKEDR